MRCGLKTSSFDHKEEFDNYWEWPTFSLIINDTVLNISSLISSAFKLPTWKKTLSLDAETCRPVLVSPDTDFAQ